MGDQIVVLDGFTLNPGDLSWEGFESIGPVEVYDRTSADEVAARAAGAAHVLTNKTPLPAATLARLPLLRYIGVLATGYNIVDVAAARQRDVTVTNVPTYGTDSVAQHVAALMLELARSLSVHSRAVHQGRWTSSQDFCFTVGPIEELTGLTMGIIGMGRIGLAVARIGAAMGMTVIAHDVVRLSADQLDGLPVEYASVENVFRKADVLSLHCPLSNENHHLVNAQRLALMKPTAYLINTSRGPLVDATALAQALREETIAGAALDVLDPEPPPADHPLLKAPRCIITPHIAWYARASRGRLMKTAVANLRAFLDGKPVNLVNA